VERVDPQIGDAATTAPRIAIAGVGGYAGGELARLLLRHPKLNGATPTFFGRAGEGRRDAKPNLTIGHAANGRRAPARPLSSRNACRRRSSWLRGRRDGRKCER